MFVHGAVMQLLEINGKKPFVHQSCYVAPDVFLIGDVRLRENVSVWFGSLLRADTDSIEINENSSIQDSVIIKPDSSAAVIGKRVTVGKGAIIEGAFIGDDVIIGMGSIILENTKIGSGSFVAAGSMLPQNTVVPEGSLVIGNPAKIVGKVTPNHQKQIEESWRKYFIMRSKYKSVTKV
jgi:carbonic anhydrase/acetyltransferase-like protein (isoleucine patch superfamily)